jgi:hypothetical protein
MITTSWHVLNVLGPFFDNPISPVLLAIYNHQIFEIKTNVTLHIVIFQAILIKNLMMPQDIDYPQITPNISAKPQSIDNSF